MTFTKKVLSVLNSLDWQLDEIPQHARFREKDGRRRNLTSQEKNLQMSSKFSKSLPGTSQSGYFVAIMSVEDKENESMKKHSILVKDKTTLRRFLQIIHDEAKKHKVSDNKFWEGVTSETPDGSVIWIKQGS